MNKKMREACLAVADCFEFAPECWTKDWYTRDELGGRLWQTGDPDAVAWCAIGGVMAAMKTDDDVDIRLALRPFATSLGYPRDPAHANNLGGRLVAIKMLRLAGGEE